MKSPLRLAPLAGFFAAAFLVAVASCTAASDDEPKSKAPSQASTTDKTTQPDLFTVPDGSPEELEAYLERLQNEKPQVQTYAAFKEFRTKQGRAMVAAADKILAAKAAPKPTERAVAAKVMGLLLLGRLGDKDAVKRLESLPAELNKAGQAKLAREVQAIVLERHLMETQGANSKELLSMIEKIGQFLKEVPLDSAGVRLAHVATRVGEATGDKKLAAKIYTQMGEILAKNNNPSIVKLGQQMQGAARRVDLMGKPLELAGVTTDGKALKWADYRGKVTLVLFWATWCGPCQQEIATLREDYPKYHDRGFEVVAVSVDEDRQKLDDYLTTKKMPWTVVVDQAREEKLPGQSMSVYYGILGIPEAFLVDRQGKVVATGVRGPKLGELLTEMLGPESPKKEADQADKHPATEKLPTLE